MLEWVSDEVGGGILWGAYFEDEDAAQEPEDHDYEAAAEHDRESPFPFGCEAGLPNYLQERQRTIAP